MSDDAASVKAGLLLLVIYPVLCAAGTMLDYMAGTYVERSYGSNTSLMFFLSFFAIVLIGAWPLAVGLAAGMTGARKIDVRSL